MKIRDSHAVINNDATEHVMPSRGLQIISDSGNTLFEVSLNKDGSIRVSGGQWCKHGGKTLEDKLLIVPVASNVVHIFKPEAKET